MNRVTKFVATALVVPAAILASTGTASASTHRGTSGCFNWSWADGTISATVYYHNTCNRTETINIWWKASGGRHIMHAATVKAGAKGHIKEDGTVESID